MTLNCTWELLSYVNLKAFGCPFVLALWPRSTAPFQGQEFPLDRMMLRYLGIYIAQSLQINSNAASPSTSEPIARGPSGLTTADTVASVDALETTATNVTTTFVGSSVVQKNDPNTTVSAPPSFIKAMTTDMLMTLKQTLCRPIRVASGSWSTADGVGTAEYSAQIPANLIALPIISRKLDGFQGVRGSITYRLQVTGNPFQQGILKLAFYPMAFQDATFSLRSTLPECFSFWPSVELNLGCATACELRVPYVMPHTFLDLVNPTPSARPDMGQLMVLVYSPLAVGSGSTTADWDLYGHWNEDDLELFNPTPNAFQSGSHHVAKHTRAPAEREKKAGSLSGALDAASTIAEVSSAIPVLSAVAGPTEWALRCASRVASALGFSRPPINENPRIVSPQEYPYNSNVEGPDVSMPLSLTTQPGLRFEPRLAARNEDEMDLDCFLARFGYQSRVTFDSSSTAGTVLYRLNLGVAQATANENWSPKPFQLMGKMFQYWRGNMRVRIKFIKTKMHSARLMFAFFPGVLTNQTLTQCEYVHRNIVDISSGEEFTYELPFTSQYPYLMTTTLDSTGLYGSFQVIVLNALQAPSTVSSSVSFIVETAMGPGSEWFCPTTSSFNIDYLPSVQVIIPRSAGEPSAPPSGPKSFINQAQSGETGGLTTISTLSDSKVVGPQIETSQLCVGEKIMSLRQLIKYPANLATSFITNIVTSNAEGITPPVYYRPFCMGATSTTGTSSVRTRDLLGIIAPYFRFSRGSMRVRCSYSGSEAANTVATPQIISTAYNTTGPGMFGADPIPANITWGGDISNIDTITKVLLPAWQNVPLVPLSYVNAATAANQGLAYRTTALRQSGFGFPGSSTVYFNYARQPADDYELLYFVGPPVFNLGTS